MAWDLSSKMRVSEFHELVIPNQSTFKWRLYHLRVLFKINRVDNPFYGSTICTSFSFFVSSSFSPSVFFKWRAFIHFQSMGIKSFWHNQVGGINSVWYGSLVRMWDKLILCISSTSEWERWRPKKWDQEIYDSICSKFWMGVFEWYDFNGIQWQKLNRKFI